MYVVADALSQWVLNATMSCSPGMHEAGGRTRAATAVAGACFELRSSAPEQLGTPKQRAMGTKVPYGVERKRILAECCGKSTYRDGGDLVR